MIKRTISMMMVAAALFLISCSSGPTDQSVDSDGKTTTLDSNGNETIGATQAKGEPIHLSEAEFITKVFDFNKGSQWKYKGDKPCIVDFYADWCGPCRMIAPYMEDLAKKYPDDIYIYKVNTDNAQSLAQAFGINSIPAVMFCPMNGEPQMTVGAYPKEDYEKLVKEFLLAKK